MDERVLKRVVIDPGHGGSDPGTIANDIIEKDYTLKISEYIKKRLDEMGISNSITRNSDITLDAKNRTNKIKSFYGNGNDVIVVSNHINAGGGDGSCRKLTFFEKLRKIFHKKKIKYLFVLYLI